MTATLNALSPASFSAWRPPVTSGVRPASPVSDMIPPMANDTAFVAWKSRYGPVSPNGVTDTTTRCGWRLADVGPVEAERGELRRLTVADDDVGAGEQRVPVGRGVLVTLAGVQVRRLVVGQRHDAGHPHVTDVGAVAAQHPPGEGRADARRDLQHTHVGEGQCHESSSDPLDRAGA